MMINSCAACEEGMNLASLWEECFEPLRKGAPFLLRKDGDAVCISHVPVSAAHRWELMFLPQIGRVIYRSKTDNPPQKLSSVSSSLMRGRPEINNSSMAAYGEILAMLEGSRGLGVMRSEESHLEELLADMVRLDQYCGQNERIPVHKQKIALPLCGQEEPSAADTDEYRSMLILLAELYNRSSCSGILPQIRAADRNILQVITAVIFLMLSNMRIPDAAAKKRRAFYSYSQTALKETAALFLRSCTDEMKELKDDDADIQHSEGISLNFLWKRAAFEEHMPMEKRLDGAVKSVDIAAISGLSLFACKRHIVERLLKRGVPVRLVTQGVLNHAGETAASWQRKYPNLTCRQTSLILPFADFIVHMENEKESSAKIDLYGFETGDDERITFCVPGQDKENFDYFVHQFDIIWARSKPN